MIFPTMSKSRLLLIINANFCALRTLRFSTSACKRCSGMVSVSATLACELIILPYTARGNPARQRYIDPPPPPLFCAQCHQSALASEPLCLHPADVCSNKPMVPARTTPFTAAPRKVAGRDEFFFLRKGRRGGGSGRCGNAPKVSRSTSSGAEPLCRPGACTSLLVA